MVTIKTFFSSKHQRPIVIIGLLFFCFGFITWLNSVLVPFFLIACQLNYFESYLVTFAFYVAYFLFAFPSSILIGKIGYRKSMSAGLLIMAVGALVFIPAAITLSYLLFLTGLFLLGAGLTLLQTAANPYAAILGPPESAARRISIMGVCSKMAGMLAPLIFSFLILRDVGVVEDWIKMNPADSLQKNEMLCQLANQCILPYLCISVCLLLLSLWIQRSSLPEVCSKEKEGKRFRPFAHPALMGGVLAIFFYVGAEVISIDTLISYALYYGISPSHAKWFPVASMVALSIGYFVGIWGIPKYFSQKQALVASSIGGFVLSVAAICTPGWYILFLLSALGLANAMIWPTVWGLAIRDMGEHTNSGSSFLIMAILGGAILPLVYGWMADGVGLRMAYILLPICYAIIGIYGWLCKDSK